MTAHNPKAPHSRRMIHDVASEKDAFVDRLRLLGASDDVLAATMAHWDDPTWEDRTMVVGLADDDLRAELAAIEREYHEGTTDPVTDEAEQIVAENHAVVIAWVRADPRPPERALAMEIVEARRPKVRTTVLAACSDAITEAGA